MQNIEKLIVKEEISVFKNFVYYLSLNRNGILLRNDLIIIFKKFCEKNSLDENFYTRSSLRLFINKIQELFFSMDYLLIMYRYDIARYRFFCLRVDGETMTEIKLSKFLKYKDLIVDRQLSDEKSLVIDYIPFYNYTPLIKDPKKIGNGTTFLNRYLSSRIFNNPSEWNSEIFQFMKMHKYQEKQLLINGVILKDFNTFYEGLGNMIGTLSRIGRDTPFSEIEKDMKKSGFVAGWGNCAGRIVETMQLLMDLLNEPDDILLEEFISRVPMPLISKVAIISPHGWFAQENVLGRPDTGGQVIYILDQVKALEKHLKKEAELSGLKVIPAIVVLTRLIPDSEGTTCNIKKEKIFGTENCYILRIPFRDRNNNVINQWISRFEIWPYLDRFAGDAATELTGEFRGRPDLIIGNYSDGNLVASILSRKLDVIMCSIAHALEKTKYLFSDLYWKNFEKDYNFSLQFVADMISMNKSDFIIASTHQEIIGTEDTMGQYESYQFFTMPGLMQVSGGVNLYTPKFNVIPPGVDESIYYPFYERERRVNTKTEVWEKRLFYDQSDDVFGHLDNPELKPVFTMARFDRIKNITGLIEAFGMSSYLQERCNLVFAAGTTKVENSGDNEEQDEIRRAYSLIEKYNLTGKVRWLPSISKIDTGEVYRIIADNGGIFVQPALFEAFGLTILEAMLSGLPTFGPMFGGPLEIIENGKSGFLLNTSKPEMISEGLELFYRGIENRSIIWDDISRAGVERVRTTFTWSLYSEKLIRQTKLYGFWRYTETAEGKIEIDRYNDIIYHFLFRERAKPLSL